MTATLVQTLFDGPIDVIGDVHGETTGFHTLREKLGYDAQGRHPEDRKLVFVGDLGDRGPDSPGLVEWIRDRVHEGRAQAVLGNHDFNAILAADGGGMKTELSWLFDEARPFSHHGHPIPQTFARGQRRDDILAFFRTLSIALERGGDFPVRVVHACWDSTMVERLRHRNDVLEAYYQERKSLEHAMNVVGLEDGTTRKLMHQNVNAVKRLSSGLEGRASQPVIINETPRWELRLPWWHDYLDPVLCIIGHYWRVHLPGESKFESLFVDLHHDEVHGGGPVMCIDYSVGKRFKERLQPGFNGHYRTHLAALRLPEKQLYFDNADRIDLRWKGTRMRK